MQKHLVISYGIMKMSLMGYLPNKDDGMYWLEYIYFTFKKIIRIPEFSSFNLEPRSITLPNKCIIFIMQ